MLPHVPLHELGVPEGTGVTVGVGVGELSILSFKKVTYFVVPAKDKEEAVEKSMNNMIAVIKESTPNDKNKYERNEMYDKKHVVNLKKKVYVCTEYLIKIIEFSFVDKVINE